MKHWVEAMLPGIKLPCTFCGAPATNVLVSQQDPKPTTIGPAGFSLNVGWTETERLSKACCFACGQRELHNLHVRDELAVVDQPIS